MKTEEKAKAYDEALDRARRIKNGEDNWRYSDLSEIIPALEEVLPQLRKGEDERIRRCIEMALTDVDEQRFKDFGTALKECIAHLEKQKEHHIPWYDYQKSKEAGYTIVPNEEYEQLIKQKEQKPNIELIQKSWYMEGYHDREFNNEPKWIIKTGEGGPKYEENPKYGQMLEAEQKPVEYLDKDKVYAIMKKLVKLAAFSQLIPINSEEYKMIDEITCDIHKLLDYPIEQKPAEKQDYSGLTELEQAIHRGFLCAGVKNVPVNIIKETAQDCLAHLPVEWSEDFDKEVENIHKRYPEVSFAKLTRIAYHFSKWANRRKDIEWSEEDERKLQRCIAIVEGWEVDYDIAYKPYSSMLKSLHPQPKAECGDKGRRGRIGITPKHIRKKAENFLSKMEPPYDADDICSAYETGAMENTNPSWSEEDSDILVRIINQVGGYTYFAGMDSEYVVNWLKSLRPQPKQEWSEVDKKVLDDAYCWLCEYAGSLIQKNHEKSSMLYEIANRLKSLRPSKKNK